MVNPGDFIQAKDAAREFNDAGLVEYVTRVNASWSTPMGPAVVANLGEDGELTLWDEDRVVAATRCPHAFAAATRLIRGDRVIVYNGFTLREPY